LKQILEEKRVKLDKQTIDALIRSIPNRFRTAGYLCRAGPEKAKCLFNLIEAVSEPVPTTEKVEELECELYREQAAEIIIGEMQQITD
jgi:hypothetical protein